MEPVFSETFGLWVRKDEGQIEATLEGTPADFAALAAMAAAHDGRVMVRVPIQRTAPAPDMADAPDAPPAEAGA